MRKSLATRFFNEEKPAFILASISLGKISPTTTNVASEGIYHLL